MSDWNKDLSAEQLRRQNESLARRLAVRFESETKMRDALAAISSIVPWRAVTSICRSSNARRGPTPATTGPARPWTAGGGGQALRTQHIHPRAKRANRKGSSK